jgi:YHS domain-containing protein
MTIILTILLACGGTSAPEPPAATPATEETSTAHDSAKVAEALKLADLADGKEDQIATKCAGCALSMDGKAAHALEVDGTTLHLCAAMCKEHFSKDPEGNLVNLLN